MPRLYVVMGVSGSGKSTIAAALADAIGGRFRDADDDHPVVNVEKMRSETPLTDTDRWPWLQAFAKGMAQTDGLVVGACSALRRTYRDHISEHAGERVCFLHLAGDRDVIEARLRARKGHFMPPALLQSQFATLEPIEPDEDAHVFDVSGSIPDLIRIICNRIGQ